MGQIYSETGHRAGATPSRLGNDSTGSDWIPDSLHRLCDGLQCDLDTNGEDPDGTTFGARVANVACPSSIPDRAQLFQKQFSTFMMGRAHPEPPV